MRNAEMFRKFRSLFCLIAAFSLTAGLLSGCSSASAADEDTEVHVAVILGNHGNAPEVNLSLAEDAIYEACLSYGSVCLICADGEPYTVEVDIEEQQSGLSSSKRKSIAQDQTEQILEAAGEMTAVTEETDYLAALQLASRYLSSCESEDGREMEKVLISLDSCLSTTGVISFTELTLSSINEEEILEQLEALQEIPDLEGVTAYIYTCGDVAGDQPDLTASDKSALHSLWQAIYKAAGAEVCMKDDLPLSSEADADLPAVSVVAVSQSSLDISDSSDAGNALEDGQIISFEDTTIQFVSGTADLADEAAASEALIYLSEYLLENTEAEILIAGTTAGWGDNETYCIPLSEARAAKVKELLVAQGVAEDRIAVIGLGSENIFYVDDHYEDGTLNEEIAQTNRSVKVMLLSSATAQEILQ